ncbi:MAG: FG-GAP-like repeat-containing protein, partial [Bacteroidota bacterium]
MSHPRLLPILTGLLCLLGLYSCQPRTDTTTTTEVEASGPTRFRLVPAEESGVQFANQIDENYEYNILNYEYLYNGGGVAIGDINNDGLPDLYFSGTFVANKLYLNRGNLRFEDITARAGVGAERGFKTGVSMVDINHDGWLDLYVCRTSKSDDGQKDNLLYLNQGDLTFTESAADYGLLDNSNSNHANFFDYDLDGDLDLYLLNHRLNFKEAVRMRLKQLPDGQIIRQTAPLTPFESDRLYRNDGNGSFTDVTQAAGLVNSAFAFGATVSDLNGDGYPDVYVTNDYIEPDYLYINNGDGTFTDRYFDYLRHSSQNSMGCDIADFNNDGLVDIVVLDMITEDPIRYKELMNIMQLERYNALVQYGYGHQVSRNVLQLNNGNGTFSEIGQLAGVAATDWSWGGLLTDLDNDGRKDLYIVNGYKRDVTNLDYMTYVRDSIEQSGGVNPQRYPDVNEFLKIIPSVPQRNYLYRNRGDLTFADVTEAWGLPERSFSNGSAYGDLDGDGDLDLVVNNIQSAAFVYENQSQDFPDAHYLQVQLRGPAQNPLGIGASVRIEYDTSLQYLEMSPTRGFFSSSQHLLHFGLGERETSVRLRVHWPDGKEEYRSEVAVDQVLVLDYAAAQSVEKPLEKKAAPWFAEATEALGIDYEHRENAFEDFNRERLLPHQLSKLGPRIAVGDANGDGLDDFYVGGALNSSGALYLQDSKARFQRTSTATWEADQQYEDLDALFFDADGDGDQDLYVVSGGAAAQAG